MHVSIMSRRPKASETYIVTCVRGTQEGSHPITSRKSLDHPHVESRRFFVLSYVLGWYAKMIIDEANKVVQWEQTAELARREAMHHAADMHGQGGGFAPGSAKERSELVQSMMSQKVNIMLLSTVS